MLSADMASERAALNGAGHMHKGNKKKKKLVCCHSTSEALVLGG